MTYLFLSISPLLAIKIAPETKKCFDDAAALLHQHDIKLGGVFDLQAAQVELLRARSEAVYLSSLTDLLAAHGLLSAADDDLVRSAKAAMAGDPLVWAKRPLAAPTVRYALSGVVLLLPLFEKLRRLVPCVLDLTVTENQNCVGKWLV